MDIIVNFENLSWDARCPQGLVDSDAMKVQFRM